MTVVVSLLRLWGRKLSMASRALVFLTFFKCVSLLFLLLLTTAHFLLVDFVGFFGLFIFARNFSIHSCFVKMLCIVVLPEVLENAKL